MVTKSLISSGKNAQHQLSVSLSINNLDDRIQVLRSVDIDYSALPHEKSIMLQDI